MERPADLARFRLRLSPLTPFLVGSGRVLGRWDTVLAVNPRSGAPLIRVIDTEKFLAESPLDPVKKAEVIEKRPAGSLERFSRYVLSCSFRDAREGLELLEFHRDGQGRPTVPASALRGLVRTVCLHAALSADRGALREGVEGAMAGRWRRDHAAGRLERRVLGRTPEEDAMRAVRIEEPSPAADADLRAYQAQVLTLAGGPPQPKLTLHLEGLDPRSPAAFEYAARVDRSALRAGPGGAAHPRVAELLEGKESLLAGLRAFSQALQEGERRFYAQAGARELGRLFEETIRRAEGRPALPFGFGSGWRSKTLGLLLGDDELQRLAPLLSPGRSYYRRGGTVVFPKSRRWILEGGRPAQPLGWVMVE